MTTSDKARWLGRLADVAAVVTLLVAGRALLPADPAAAGAPWWARTWDLIIFGPDAGAWAANASALFDGRIADLDPHRMPTWPILTAAAMHLYPDVGLAGHLVNHVLQALLPLAIWAVARAWDGRATAFMAGITTVCLAPQVTAAQRFGVDATVATMLPLALVAAVYCGRSWLLAPIVGVLTAACAISHLTTLAFPVPILLLALFAGKPGWRRWLGFFIAAAVTAQLVKWVVGWYPVLEKGLVANVFAEGIAPEHRGGADGAGTAKQAAALEILRQNAPLALNDAVRFLVQSICPKWVPWPLAIALPWLGLLGPVRPTDSVGAALRRGLGLGLPLAMCLAPVLAFHAAKAPSRYSENLLPVAALLIARGAMVLPSLLDRVLLRLDKRAVGAVMVLLAAPWAWSRWTLPREPFLLPQPRIEELLPAAVGKALLAHFPSGTGAISAYREALGYGGFLYCPNATCPFHADEDSYLACIEIMRKECRGDGPIPYVIYPMVRSDLQWADRTQMDAWVASQLTPIEEVTGGGGRARIYEIPRTGPLSQPP